MKELEKKSPAIEAKEKGEHFNGYTIEELRYQRAIIALRKEFCKANLVQSVHQLRPKRKEKNGSFSSKFSLAAKIASKVFANLNVLDYVMMGMSIFGTAKKGYKLIRGKK